ncbi:hypothetical protein NC653_012840 [Populus alba x Populus x berolinensis]|uniref:Uncharacterized protein n=1 Tax=Populus alba x Populus x berolinensis TaxID=444605 RepID=A0AAD6W1X6_9ROSI|nr:hypothetical protein NC653_012840 [Populus alba x Populus x berolinensis]
MVQEVSTSACPVYPSLCLSFRETKVMEGDGIEEGLESATGPLLLGEKSTSNTKPAISTPSLLFLS